MSNETKKILKRRAAFAPLLMSAIMVTILIVVAGSPEATPVPRAAAAAPTIKPSVNVIASVQCQGTIANTTDSTDLPNGNVDWGFGFLLGSPAAKFPARGKPAQKVNGVFGLEIDGSCQGLNTTQAQVPCAQGGQFAGTIAAPPATSPTSPGTMTISFSDLTGVFAAEGKDVLDGCTATFQVLPFAQNLSANLITSAALGGTCKAAGTSLVLECLSHNY